MNRSSDSSLPQNSNFKFAPDYVVYPPKEQGIYPIRESDWARLKRLISKIIPSKRIFEIIGSVLLGVSGSTILSLFAFYTTETLHSWVIPTAWSILVISIILGVAFLFLEHQKAEITTVAVDDVLHEMEDIEQCYLNLKTDE